MKGGYMKRIKNAGQTEKRLVVNNSILFVFAISICMVPLPGQIVIDWTEIPHSNGIEWTKNTADSVAVDLGTPGGPQSWDFTSQAMGPSNDTMGIVPVASTPFVDSFPSANLCYISVHGGDTIYSYYDLNNSFIADFGYGCVMSDTVVFVRYDPVDTCPLPFLYGTDRHYCYGWTIAVDANNWARYDCYGTVVCDAYGSVTIPYGQYECLCRRSFDTLSLTIYINSIPVLYDTTTVIKYGFMAEGYSYVVCAASYPEETDPYFTNARQLDRLIYFSGIEENESIMKNSASHHPTPFSDNCVISYSLTYAGAIDVAIYDTDGRLVRVLIKNETQSAGDHTVKWFGRDDAGKRLPAGVYFYHLKTGNSSRIGKMIMVK
jgi:hypothetical protein